MKAKDKPKHAYEDSHVKIEDEKGYPKNQTSTSNKKTTFDSMITIHEHSDEFKIPPTTENNRSKPFRTKTLM